MPNHVTNHIMISGDPKRIQELFEAVKYDDVGVGSLDFNKVIPKPASLDIECGSNTDAGLKAYRDFISVYTLEGTRKGLNLLNINPEVEERFLQERTDIDREVFALGKQAYQNILMYGAPTWYEWSIENWGTKWNAYGYEENEVVTERSGDNTLWMNTAWGAPHPVIAKLAELYPDLTFEHEWADEDIGNNCGRKTYENGECTETYYPEERIESVEFACKVHGYESMQDLGLSKNASGDDIIDIWSNEYEAVFVCEQPALFANEKLTDADIPEGLFCYYLRNSDDGDGYATLEPKVTVNLGGTIITSEPIEFPVQGYIEFTDENYPHFIGEDMNFENFMYGEFEDFAEGVEEPKL